MIERTINEVKKVEEDIYLALQILRNEIETLTIIKEYTTLSNPSINDVSIIIQDELAESVNSIEQLVGLHKNLKKQIDKLEVLVQGLLSTKA